jgi:long-chain acyl-CoA synthetase
MNQLQSVAATLPDLLDRSVQLHARRLALVMRQGLRDDRWTYARLACASLAWSAHLREQGLQPGDRILVQSPGSPRLVAAMFGAFRAGLVLVPLDLQCSPAFIRQVATDTQARAMLAPGHASLPAGMPLISIEALPDAPRQALERTVKCTDLAEIVFTSGTTAQPKGVMLTHGNITSNVNSAAVLPHGPDHRLLSVLPVSHMLEQTGGLYLPLASGSSIAFTTSLRSSALMAALAERRPTTLVAVPRLLDLLLQAIVRDVERRGRLRHWQAAHTLAARAPGAARRLLFLPVHQALGGSLRWIFCGGSALAPELQSAWQRLGVTVMQGYGATECSPFVSCQRAVDTSLGMVGRALPGVCVRLADDGELTVRGPNVTSGYWHSPQATAEALHDGWYATGDLARINLDGDIYLLGRKREMIALPSGMNVFPADVDSELARESAFEDSASVGWSSDGVPAVHAVVIPRAGVQRSDLEEAIRSTNARLATHQQITGWSVWPGAQLPLTATHKVRRGEIVEWLRKQQHSVSAASTDSSAQTSELVRLLAQATGRWPSEIGPETALASGLGLDSLARVELAVAIEQNLGVVVSDEAMGELSTVSDLERLISGSGARPTAPPPATWPFWRITTDVRSAMQYGLLFPLLDRICRPLQVVGLENVELASQVLLVANHASHLDAALVLRTLPPRIRRSTAVAAAQDYFFTSRRRALPAQLLLGAFPLARTGSILPSMEQCGRLADRARSILVFPEGTRSLDGQVHEFKAGIGLLARQLRLPVVPIGINGTAARLPKGQLLPNPGDVRVSFGAPVRRDPSESDEQFAHRLQQLVISLID